MSFCLFLWFHGVGCFSGFCVSPSIQFIVRDILFLFDQGPFFTVVSLLYGIYFSRWHSLKLINFLQYGAKRSEFHTLDHSKVTFVTGRFLHFWSSFRWLATPCVLKMLSEDRACAVAKPYFVPPFPGLLQFAAPIWSRLGSLAKICPSRYHFISNLSNS